MPGLTAASISENPLHKGTITQQSSAGRVFKGLGVAKRGQLAKRKESYAKSHPIWPLVANNGPFPPHYLALSS